jgi:hypothetical protein
MATVPNVAGMFQANANTAIEAAQLLASSSYQFFEPPALGLDRVLSQIPAAGSSVPSGSVVRLVISAAPVGIVDIGTFGNSLSSAVTLLTSSGGDLWIGSVAIVSANVTVPSNVQLMFGRNGQLSVNSGVTVTIQGTVPPEILDRDVGKRALSRGKVLVHLNRTSTGTNMPHRELLTELHSGSVSTLRRAMSAGWCATTC